MRCLDPRCMAESKEVCLAQMKRMLHHLVGANHVEESACDDILREFGEFCDFAALQASVERGFSINKELIVENQKEASLVAQRLIVGHIRSVGSVTNVQLTKELLISVSGARQRYHSYLDDQKRDNGKEKSVKKRKALGDELDELKKKRARVENDIGALEKSADEYADKAESTGKLTFITKSNSLRRTAKEKKASLQDLEKQIDEKLAEMKQ
ncbi:hypothetical protein SKAU_G00194570 [Synaphobranchus kaupii]|uniref:Uncharacterized protein n=1 Tax=Synaphobranchus kaupii TaxID=118154 RepID=A0A9Q1IXL0_SYNKA|nr:hypothetical protein SKAU_G00194570 [Synaphobranchus kaupii]